MNINDKSNIKVRPLSLNLDVPSSDEIENFRQASIYRLKNESVSTPEK